jgi:serine protease Do
MKRMILMMVLVVAGSSWVAADPGDGVNLRRTIVVDVVQRTKDAVVYISAQKMVTRVRPLSPFFQGFGPGQLVQVPANSLGSGFIIHEDGYVVTNNHVIDRATEVTVQLADGRNLPATVISADPDADLAILRIRDGKPLPVVELGDSSDLMIGEPVIAVGNPLGYSHTVSTGIVSALHRDLNDTEGKAKLMNLIQTDAAINPGNSGGPLLNAYGQVIGINTAIRSDAQNIGFAIQVNKLRDLIPELMNPAQAIRVDVPLKLAERRTLRPPDHIEARVVSANQPERVVGEINGRAPRDIVDAYAMLLAAKAGQKFTVDWRGGATEKLTATAVVVVNDVHSQVRKSLGVTVEALTAGLVKKYDLSVDEGVLVTAVTRGSVAGNAGVQPGDVIVALGNYRVRTMEDLSTLVQHLPEAGNVGFRIVRADVGMQGAFNFGAGQ